MLQSTTPRRAAIYARVSTLAQDKRDPWSSLPRQKEALVDLARRHDLDVLAVYQETISGAKDHRPQFEEMMGLVKEGAVQAVLTVDFSRLTRTERLGEFELIKDEFRAAGCSLITLSQVYDFVGVDQETMSDIQAAIVKGERLKIRERTLAGKEAKLKAGGWIGTRIPYGYRNTFDSQTGARRFEPDAEQVETLRHLYDQYIDGMSFSRLAAHLNARGVVAPGGKGWNDFGLRYILTNPIYIGLQRFEEGGQSKLVPSRDFPAVLDPARWERAQEAVQRRARFRQVDRTHRNPLAGILRCPGCGYGVTLSQRYDQGGYYVCRATKDVNVTCAERCHYRAHVAHAAVLDWLKQALPRYISEQRARELAMTSEEGPDEDLIAIQLQQARIEELRSTRSGLLRMAATGKMGEELAMGEALKVDGEIRAAEAEVSRLERVRQKKRAPAAQALDLVPLAEAIALMEPDDPDLRAAFQTALREVYLDKRVDPHDNRRIKLSVTKARLVDGSLVAK